METKTIGREKFENLLKYKMRPEDIEFVMRAYGHSKNAHCHKNQIRDTGERYFEHPKAVALILIQELEIYDPDLIAATLLHDVLEDTYFYGAGEKVFKEIERAFNARTARFVRFVTKLKCKEEEKAARDEAYYNAIDEAEEEVRILKFADRLHNLRTLKGCPQKKIKRYLKETKEHFFRHYENGSRTFNLLQMLLIRAYQEVEKSCA